MFVSAKGTGGGGGNYEPLYEIVDISDSIYTLTAAGNTEYRFGAVTSLDIVLPDGVLTGSNPRYATLINFTTGDTAPTLSYNDINLKGDDVTVETDEGGSYYEFSPQPNTRYSIGILWDGSYIMGYVSGTELIESEAE